MPNFGVLGMGMKGSAETAGLLAKLYHPRLIIIGTGFMDIGVGLPDNAIAESPIVRYNQANFNFDGWITSSSLAFRDYLARDKLPGNRTTAHTQNDFLLYTTRPSRMDFFR